jgi:hypothetical protein
MIGTQVQTGQIHVIWKFLQPQTAGRSLDLDGIAVPRSRTKLATHKIVSYAPVAIVIKVLNYNFVSALTYQ